ncbi:MAG: terminase [Ammonifex sp.]|nr:MAG: terminase [Ammonifex sp.]
MAKDGTNRGGRRVRAGDKPQPLADKITAGKAARILEAPELHPESMLEAGKLDGAADLYGVDMPTPSDYLSARQRDGKPLGADALFIETWKWLKERGCEKFVNPRLIEAYAQAFTRYIQCEEAISTYGLLGKHPTTGGAIASPFVQMSQSFQKQANLLWYEIFDIVKQNCTTAFVGNPQDDVMERLLSTRKGG